MLNGATKQGTMSIIGIRNGLLLTHNERRCLGCDTLAAARKSETLGSCRFYAHVPDIDTKIRAYIGAHLLYVRKHLRSLGYDCDIGIDWRESFAMQYGNYFAQKHARVDAFPARVGIGEMTSDVTESGCAQQSIGKGMEGHVSITMTQEAEVMRDIDATYYAGATFDEAVHVEAVAYSDIGNHTGG